jgi:ATP-dependent exoDNAse (exonuclease V) beta subunit
MKLIFEPQTHTYKTNQNEEYVSVTKLLSRYKQPFDAPSAALKASRNKKSKWYGMQPQDIVDVWNGESQRSIRLGNWYHDQRERDLLECKTISYMENTLTVHKCLYDEDGMKVATDQRISEGVYPEFFLYLPSAKIAGQSDRVTVANGRVDILDYKTNKEIKTQSYKNYEGISQKMLYPLNHLDDCNLNHYTVQLSIYMYIILRHNPMYHPGELTLHHIIFEEDYDRDPYGYPIYLKDDDGNFKIKEVIPYKVPYLKDEVHALIEHFKENK